jgi:hypothetical protein
LSDSFIVTNINFNLISAATPTPQTTCAQKKYRIKSKRQHAGRFEAWDTTPLAQMQPHNEVIKRIY